VPPKGAQPLQSALAQPLQSALAQPLSPLRRYIYSFSYVYILPFFINRMNIFMEQNKEDYFIVDQPIDTDRRIDINYQRLKLFIKLHHFLVEDKSDSYLYTYKLNYLKRLFSLLNNKYMNAISNVIILCENNNINTIDAYDNLFTIIETLYRKDNLIDVCLLAELIKYIEIE
jgi:hypothetical protein